MNAIPNQQEPVTAGADAVTVLQAKQGLAMTKTFTPGGVQSYDQAKFFTPYLRHVKNLRDLSKLLSELAGKPRCCIIRGAFKGPEHAQSIDGAVDGPNLFLRRKQLYDDPAHHWLLIDIDGYEPVGVDPVASPVDAIEQFIERKLPPEFVGKSYHWQLSASAGTPGRRHLLKAHVWFWSKTPYNSAQLKVWAKAIGPAVDSAVFRVVQVHYTADPVFRGGATDPVPVGLRHGFVDGWDGDEVDLVLDEVLLARALQAEEDDADDYDLVDPRQKKGVIGAFCRAFTVEEILDEFLSDEFEWEEGSDRRVTWLNGGGTPGGCFVTDDRLHLCSVHNTDPLDNRAVNLFDLVRHYKFGHLDEGHDEFEIMEMADKPSYQAMVAWAEELEPVRKELEAGHVQEQVEARSLREQLIARVAAAESEAQLREEICPVIRSNAGELEKVDIDLLAEAVKSRLGAVTGARVTIAAVRDMLRPPRRELGRADGLPRWAHPYVFVAHQSRLYHYVSGASLSREAFEFMHNPDAGFDQDGNQVSAYAMVRDNPATPRVDGMLYMPHLDAVFELDGRRFVNSYRPSTIPQAKSRELWTEKDMKAVVMAERHIELLCDGRPAVKQALIDWLAYCARDPGSKVTYSWLIVGGEGAGKTWIAQMMTVVMGGPNVRVVSVQEVLNPTFNGWAEGASFSAIEEVRIHGHKQDAWDNLKPVLTNPTIVITKKGLDSYNAPNVTNYIMFSNHDDAVPMALGGRRVGVIKTPFHGDETKQQLDAMAIGEGFADSAAYFDALFGALDNHGPAIREWLTTWPVSADFNPKGRAPETDEREAMARMGVSHDEEVARAVIEEGRPWVTSSVVNPGRLADAMRNWPDFPTEISADKVSFILRKMGYVNGGLLKYKGTTVRLWHKGLQLPKDKEGCRHALRAALEETEVLPGAAEADFLA